ncbi:MAG: AmmeMemoRadiSam system protein B, partial [Candidatus Omnitrophota bacterium]|nr:AmmeMemoRadiSam system protein B [Candidatus Omnitrophota bacterium]
MSGDKRKKFLILSLSFAFFALRFTFLCFAQQVKQPGFAGTFYPADPQELSVMLDGFLEKADPKPVNGDIFALISPHAGLGYSGQTAAYGYKLIKDKPYKTVIVIAPSHQFAFTGVSVYPEGYFRTPLGDV